MRIHTLRYQLQLSFLLFAATLAQIGQAAEKNAAADNLPAHLAGYSLTDTALRDTGNWQPPKRILVTFDALGITAGLEDVLSGIEIISSPGPVAKEASGDFDAVLVMCAAPNALNNIGKINWMHSYSAGVEGCLQHKTLQANPNATMTNSRGAAAETIAEHAIAMMMSLGRQLPTFRDSMQQGKWTQMSVPRANFRTFRGKTLLVLGLGRIGTETARIAHGLGMTVMATRNSRREGPDFVSHVGLSSESVSLAAQADVVINALPFTPSTNKLVNGEFLKAMPEHAMLINVGRGGTVDTAALIHALDTGEIAAAGLDVTDPEPLPADNKLWSMKNVLITPHVAASSDQALQATRAIARENLKRFVNGDRLINPVNRQRAY